MKEYAMITSRPNALTSPSASPARPKREQTAAPEARATLQRDESLFGTVTRTLGLRRPTAAPTSVPVQLTAAEARELSQLTGIPFKAGRQTLTAAMLEGASVEEPLRGDKPVGDLPRYPLKLEDFTAPQKLRHGVSMAGRDGVLDAEEIRGVVRNVQALVRSQMAQEFFAKYPVPEAGILVYSANMLAMNGAYGQSDMFNTLANGIMPVDNLGKPKNEYWQAYADAYDRHKATGAPSMEVLESLWFKAHMVDFEIVDTPGFQEKLEEFWRQADSDPAYGPMATYTRAMVGGRQEFEEAAKAQVSDETAFMSGISHFAKTVLGSGSFPFWQQDLREAGRWVLDRKTPELDDRGLPTDKALFERSVQGVRMMTGLRPIITRGVLQSVSETTDRKPVGTMVDLSKVLSPEQLAQVDPKVREFYQNPANFDIRTGVEFEGFLSRILLGEVASTVSGFGDIPDRKDGFENYPLESEVYRDAQGRGHWDRYAVVDGERKTVFNARFEVEGRQIKETFNVHGKDVALYFDVTPYQGGIRLTLDKDKSSKLTTTSNIVFTTTPTGDGLKTIGHYTNATRLAEGRIEFRMAKKAS